MDALDDLLLQIHPVDQQAMRVWIFLRSTFEPHVLTDGLYRAMYGYRYWPRVRVAILSMAQPGPLAARAITVADAATRTARVDRDQLLGIALVGVDMFDRLGVEGFSSASERVPLSAAAQLETPTMVLRRRARNRPESILGALPGVQRRWCVTREPDPNDTYVVGEGDVLARCRGGNHERCDVGVVAGADRLSPMPDGERFPLVRRACETRVFGRVSLLAAL